VASSRSRRLGAGAVLLVIIVVGALAVTTARHFAPLLRGNGCLVHGRHFDVSLTSDQAGIAATIAGVANHRQMPERAVTIAYAAALQESDLTNLPYGDRDSVGIFQQRPSEGWGTRRQLLDPVYASWVFFGALAHVAGYRHLPVYQAAQAVQHSADGQAYSQYTGQGAEMAAGFSGQVARDVWCWYGTGVGRSSRLATANRELARTFGPVIAHRSADPSVQIGVTRPAAGWAIAAWLVSHAATYGIHTIRFAGYQWAATRGQNGWTRYQAGGRRPALERTLTFG
jgi:hypothetical protein